MSLQIESPRTLRTHLALLTLRSRSSMDDASSSLQTGAEGLGHPSRATASRARALPQLPLETASTGGNCGDLRADVDDEGGRDGSSPSRRRVE